MMDSQCHHFDQPRDVTAGSTGCEDCERIGSWWVHLRICLECGHVGCCDDSPNRHATGHAHSSEHPVIASFEPGERWGYCYVHELFLSQLPSLFRIHRSQT